MFNALEIQMTQLNYTEHLVAVQQTADLIMVEARASAPCDLRHIRNWLIDQCAFGYTYMSDAIDQLVEDRMIDVDADGTLDLHHNEIVNGRGRVYA